MELPKRFWDKVKKTESGCWLWTGTKIHSGYGLFWWDGRMQGAHRVAYSVLVGEIPEGLELDHVKEWGCEYRNCVNPAHLEPVTHAENIRRGRTGEHWAAKTHCPQGHPYDEENTYLYDGRRYCKECMRTRAKERTRKRREARNASK